MKNVKTFKALQWVFTVLGLMLSHLACAHVPYAYCNAYWMGKNYLTSAPPRVALLFLIPYGVGIAVCAVLALTFRARANQA